MRTRPTGQIDRRCLDRSAPFPAHGTAAQFIQEHLVLLLYALHVPVELAQEPFNRLLVLVPTVCQLVGKQFLVTEIELVAFTAADVIDAIAHMPDKGNRSD